MNLDQDDIKLQEKNSQRGIYLLPNILTTAALFAGFYSIVAAMKSHFEMAAIAIFVAMIADGLDGRVARLTNTQTAFGREYDSLSDMVAFGIAPALLAYSWSLAHLGKIGWLIVFLYAAATALRLARFNTQVNDKKYFQGLPCPPSAALMASSIWLCNSYGLDARMVEVPLAILTILLAVLMVSMVRYYSFKSVDVRGRISFFTVVVLVFILASIALEPEEFLFGFSVAYTLSGIMMTLYQIRKVRKQRWLEQHHK